MCCKLHLKMHNTKRIKATLITFGMLEYSKVRNISLLSNLLRVGGILSGSGFGWDIEEVPAAADQPLPPQRQENHNEQ